MTNLKIFMIVLSITLISCGKTDERNSSAAIENKGNNTIVEKAKVTFVELGSVSCIPCKQMQPVMKAIEENYSGQVKVVFHDVWKDKAAGKKYGIDLIPTQVFLDENGNEFFRHQGFFPESEIVKLLEKRGIMPSVN
jgi:thioredoxin 1